MTITIRPVLSLIVAVAAFMLVAPQVSAQDQVKIDKIIAKTETKLESTVGSYDRKIDALVAKCTIKVNKMVAKGTEPAKINEYINKTIMTGMNHASSTRAKIDKTETSAMRSLAKYGSPAEATAEVAEFADDCISQVDEMWEAAGTALHALEVE